MKRRGLVRPKKCLPPYGNMFGYMPVLGTLFFTGREK